MPVALHTPSEVKAAVTGSGRADKAQVTHMVTRLLRMTDPPRPADAADALALAICHLWRGGAQARLAAAAAAAAAARGGADGRASGTSRRSPMIAHLDGVVTAVAPEGAVIDVGGVGLLVQCSPGTLAGLRPGERTKVSTSLVVREDALTLYGFGSDDERNTFELLQTASGIGPRLALAMLATFSPDGLRRAVAAEDVTALTSVPGIGRKGAQRIVLELAGRLGSPGEGSRAGTGSATGRRARGRTRPDRRRRGPDLAGPGAHRPGQPRLAGQGRGPGDRHDRA